MTNGEWGMENFRMAKEGLLVEGWAVPAGGGCWLSGEPRSAPRGVPVYQP